MLLTLSEAVAAVGIEVFDVRGRRLAATDVGPRDAGAHSIGLREWGGAERLRPGLYFLRVRADGFEQRLRWVKATYR